MQGFFRAADSPEPYKKTIEQFLCPDIHNPIRISSVKRAIIDHKKAANELTGLLEVMVYCVECGTQCSVDHGDIDKGFYYSLQSMFDRILNVLLKNDQEG